MGGSSRKIQTDIDQKMKELEKYSTESLFESGDFRFASTVGKNANAKIRNFESFRNTYENKISSLQNKNCELEQRMVKLQEKEK